MKAYRDYPHQNHHKIVIIGAGFAGLGMAARLLRRGETDFVVLERAEEVGGTWFENTYPGCACDVKSDLYSFSFAPNPDWSHRYARQPEILAYLKRCADDFGVRPYIRFNCELRRAVWDDAAARWQLETADGPLTAHILISGHGPLNTPKWPDIPGLEAFTGVKFHSSRWNHGEDLRGKRIAVVGTGATGVQVVPHLQGVASQLTVFQRTPPWVFPREDKPISERRRRWFRRAPLLQRLSRQAVFSLAELKHLSFTRPMLGAWLEGEAKKFLQAHVRDPVLRAKLTPDYRVGCKRILVSDDYYPALTQPNVELVTDAVLRVDENRFVTADARERTFDVVVGATGFRATEPPIARVVYGRDGRSLADSWQGKLEALHGTTVAGFPNLFMLVGPNTGLGHNSIVYIIEAQIGYILRALRYMERNEVLALEPTRAAQTHYNDRLQEQLGASVWTQGGCGSWYLDKHGRNTTLWPGWATSFRLTLRRFDPALYSARREARPRGDRDDLGAPKAA